LKEEKKSDDDKGGEEAKSSTPAPNPAADILKKYNQRR
jgi:hypothetical protein